MSAPVFVVTGMHRSGTSCMMGCLVAGGMRGNYSTGKDNELTRRHALVRPDYEPNPKGFFEGAEVPLHEARGMVTKRMLSRFPRSLPGDPAATMRRLTEAGWPIADPDKAAAWVDPTLWRHRAS